MIRKRYGREYADPYLGHGIGPVPGYGVSELFTISACLVYKLCFKFEIFRRPCIAAATIALPRTKGRRKSDRHRYSTNHKSC